MECGAALYFDKTTDAAIRGLWQVIEDAGLHSGMLRLNYPPHLTILTCEDSDLPALSLALNDFLANHPPIEISFHSLGVFNSLNGIVYLAPVPSLALLRFHAALWKIAEPFLINPSPLYRPGAWVPHVTLNMDIPSAQTGAVINTLLSANLPRRGLLTSLFVAEFGPDALTFEELHKARLGENLSTGANR